jgi:hypothetical protein
MAVRYPFKITIDVQCVRVGCASRLPPIESHDPRFIHELGNVLSNHGWDYRGICPKCQVDYRDALEVEDQHGGKRAFAWSDEQKRLYAEWEAAWDSANPKPPDWHELPEKK